MGSTGGVEELLKEVKLLSENIVGIVFWLCGLNR